MIDISKLSDEAKRIAIVKHINTMNSIQHTSPSSLYNVSDYELNILVCLVTKLIDSPFFSILKPIEITVQIVIS